VCWTIAVHLSLPCGLFHLCRESYLCRALVSIFPVTKVFAVRFYLCARQRFLCRAGTHGKEMLHGDAYFSRSASYSFSVDS
jgi:hypothetical protein